MSANAINREVARDKLTALLAAALVGAGKPATAVYGYPVADLSGASPVVMVTSSGSKRTQYTRGVSQKNASGFRLDILNFVSAPNIATGWTGTLAENMLDLLEKSEADVISDNRGQGNDPTLPWQYIETEDTFSDIAYNITVGGAKYWVEAFSILVTIRDN